MASQVNEPKQLRQTQLITNWCPIYITVENKGGQALPCIVDIQSEEQVKNAFSQAVDKFGGVDVLVNNASAIHLTGTEMTPNEAL